MRILQSFVFMVLFLFSTILFAIPNPASVNCIKQGNKLVLIQNTGICIFPDGTYCEEWAFFRGQCAIGQNTFPNGAFDIKQVKTYCITKVDKTSKVTICKLVK